MKKLLTLAAWLGLTVAGCTLAPKYHRPPPPVSAAWPDYAATNSSSATNNGAAALGWHEFFSDPQLQQLVGIALTNNRDLRMAVLNVQVSQAQYRVTRATLVPQVNANGNYVRQRSPSYLLFPGESVVNSQYNANIGTTAYELDLFGRVQSLTKQAFENYLATTEARRNAQIALVATVATEYLTLLENDEQLAIARQTLESVQAAYDLNKKSYDVGNTSELDVRSAEAQVQAAKVSIANYQLQRNAAQDALVLLLGEPMPTNLPAGQPLNGEGILTDLPAGLPSELLVRRPDILQAEHQLEAANANIGAARAAFFPSISITANAGFSSDQLAKLFEGGSFTWLVNPQITVPIFTAGLNKANLDIANLEKDINIANYEKSIQTAFREVADGLSAKRFLADEIAEQEKLVQAQQGRFDLANARYRNGVDNYLTVLLAQQDLYTAQQNLVSLRFARLSNLVTLYQALGGGWVENAAR